MTYRIVYDASAVTFGAWPLAAAGLVAGAVGVALLAAARRLAHRAHAARRLHAAGLALALLGPAWTVVVGGGLWAEHARLRSALRDGAFAVVEGIVHDRPGATDGRAAGSWAVERGDRAQWYRYGPSWRGAGYRRKRPGAGALRSGTRVRIADVGGRIARLEIADGERR